MNVKDLNLSEDGCYVLAQIITAVDYWHAEMSKPRFSRTGAVASLRGLAAEIVSIFASAGFDEWDTESVCYELTADNLDVDGDDEITIETLLSIPLDQLQP